MTNLVAELFHAENTRDSFFYMRGGSIYNETQAEVAFIEGGYTKVASFEVSDDSIDSLEQVYGSSQNIHCAWRPSNPCRSTSVGDIVKIGEKLYIVAGCGFEELGPKGE